MIKIIRQISACLKKDILLLYKRKKYLYVFILLPLIIASLFLFFLNPSLSNIDIGICDLDNTQASQQITQNLQGFNPIILDKTNCVDNLQSDIKSGKFSLGMVIGHGFSSNLNNMKQSKITIYYDNTDIAFSNMVSWKVDNSLSPAKRQIIDTLNQELKNKINNLRNSLDIALLASKNLPIHNKLEQTDNELEKVEEIDTEFLVRPIWTDKQPVYTETAQRDSAIAFIFPIIALFIGLMLSSTSLIYDKQSGYLTRVKAASSPLLYILSKFIFFFILTCIEFLIIFGLFILTGASYHFPLSLLNMLLLISIINTSIGLIIGLLADNEGIAILFSLIIAFPLMLLSGIFYPIQTMPSLIQWITNILPLQYQIEAVKTSLLFNQSLNWYWLIPATILLLIIYKGIKRK
ncbi:MAG: ABC transporter permease [Candidatus Nanoarchaeia archaeon]